MNVVQVIPKDAIPSVDDPTFTAEYDGRPEDEVLVLDGDPPKAYPLRYLNYHEIVNDSHDGRSVAVTWCPLCGSAVVYDSTLDGRTLTFGVSGKLADDDLVMYDRQTGSEWKQSLGTAIAGEYQGSRLRVLPAAVTTCRRFAADHPDGVVLAPPGGTSETSGEGVEQKPIEYDREPYRDYFESDGFGLAAHHGKAGRDWSRDDLGPKDVVLGIEQDGEAVGFPRPRVEAAGGVANATVGTRQVVVFVTPDGIHAFGTDHAFEPTADPGTFRADGTLWDGSTGTSDDGRSLDRAPAKRLFAFAWQDDHGPDAVWSPD